MPQKNVSIWIWIQYGKIIKAILCPDDGTIRIFDENDKLILKRTGLNRIQIKLIEKNIIKYGAKRLSQQAEPFKFL